MLSIESIGYLFHFLIMLATVIQAAQKPAIPHPNEIHSLLAWSVTEPRNPTPDAAVPAVCLIMSSIPI